MYFDLCFPHLAMAWRAYGLAVHFSTVSIFAPTAAEVCARWIPERYLAHFNARCLTLGPSYWNAAHRKR